MLTILDLFSLSRFSRQIVFVIIRVYFPYYLWYGSSFYLGFMVSRRLLLFKYKRKGQSWNKKIPLIYRKFMVQCIFDWDITSKEGKQLRLLDTVGFWSNSRLFGQIVDFLVNFWLWEIVDHILDFDSWIFLDLFYKHLIKEFIIIH